MSAHALATSSSWLIRRWWFWVLGVVALLACIALTIRLSGEAAWRHELAAVRAGGAPATLAELAALAPPVDAARQERLWSWGERVAQAEYRNWRVPDDEVLAALGAAPGTRSRQQVRNYCASPVLAADLTELSALLDEGPVYLGSPGWIAQDLSRLAAIAAEERRLRGLSVALYHIMWGYLDRAWELHDRGCLRRLDQLLSASRPVGSRDDFWIHSIIEDVRNQAYLAFHAAGQLPAERLTSWLQEPSDAATLAASASDGERVVLLSRLAGSWCHSQPAYAAGWRATMDALLINGVDLLWWPRHLVRISREQSRMTGILRGTVPASALASAPPPTWLELQSASRAATDQLRLVGYDAIHALNHHRIFRAAALAISALRSGALPADQAAAEAQLAPYLHAAATFLPPLRYERLSPTRFRIGLDPTGPLPVFVPFLADRSSMGQPASTAPAEVEAWSVELDGAGWQQTTPLRSADAATPGAAGP